jgi:succinate dehydrogenase/fumarate reductase cytochrome b subunit
MILSGLRAWTVQRLTAVYLLLFLLFTLVRVAWHPPACASQGACLAPAAGAAQGDICLPKAMKRLARLA